MVPGELEKCNSSETNVLDLQHPTLHLNLHFYEVIRP